MKLEDFKEFELKETNLLTGGDVIRSCIWKDGRTELEYDDDDFSTSMLSSDNYDDRYGDPHLGQT